jgi:hypothetical protein
VTSTIPERATQPSVSAPWAGKLVAIAVGGENRQDRAFMEPVAQSGMSARWPRVIDDHRSPLVGVGYVGEVAEVQDRQELLTALTTEHFTLQSARSQTASESASRASLYILSVSSVLVALGFIGQASQIGTTFEVFALTVLPTLYVLGVFTFVRVVECGAEDFRYGVAINRIRNYYKQIAGDQAELFLLSGHDDGRGVFENAAVPFEGRKQFFTFATVVAVINSVVGGSAIAIALGAIADTSLGAAAGAGGVAALVSVVALLRKADRLLEERAGRTESIFPSPH